MNKIEFIVKHEQAYDGTKYTTVNIKIDDIPLAEIMREIELPMAEKEGKPQLAGGYDAIGIPKNPEKYFLGQEVFSYDDEEDEEKIEVQECACGSDGCWPLLCKVEVGDKTVIWKDFEQPHRSVDSAASYWDYSGFDGFVFGKEQYMEALKGIKEFA